MAIFQSNGVTFGVMMPSDHTFTKGVIEGFFGKPWAWAPRLDCADFLAAYGYDFYIYAPKADPFLRRRWRESIPAETQKHLAQVTARCEARRIVFGVGLSPFEIYLDYDLAAQRSLRSKVEQINEIRAGILCLLFDDMRGDVDRLPDLQAEVVAQVSEWSNAGRIIVCPTYYSSDARLAHVFGPAPVRYLENLGRLIDPQIDVFWTGEKVISDGYSDDHLRDVAAQIRRKPFIWDNHVSNDSKARTNRLFLDPSADSWSLPTDLVAGLAINPMNQPYLSRIALGGYRDLLTQPLNRSSNRSSTLVELVGQPVAERLLTDGGSFQTLGLDGLDASTRTSLSDFYAAQNTNPYAQEISAWLQGDYVFDPQCLTA